MQLEYKIRFCNHTRQLQTGKIHANSLRFHCVKIHFVARWERIFCWESERWGGTGVASLTEVEGAQCLGAAALLSSEELGVFAAEIFAYQYLNI